MGDVISCITSSPSKILTLKSSFTFLLTDSSPVSLDKKPITPISDPQIYREASSAMASNQQVKLFGKVGSPFVARAEIALKLKGVEYEYIHESLSNKSDLLLKYNPVHKKVPVLLHNEKPVCESLVIVEYVDEAWTGHPILPSDPYHRALARFWSKFIDDKLLPAVFKTAWNPDEKEREKGAEESREALKILDKELKVEGKFFNGDSIGILDIVALIIAFWLPIIEEASEIDLYNAEKYPKLDRWLQEILNHPVVKGVLPSRDHVLALK